MTGAAQTEPHVLVVGASGTIGAAVVECLVAEGHRVTAAYRSAPEKPLVGAQIRIGDVAQPAALFAGTPHVVISCIASRRGAPKDAWAIDYEANRALLEGAKAAGTRHFILLSAICVQKPRLAFQHAKLAFEAELQESGLIWTIVRPTAFFKSLSGQVERVRQGKRFLLFGDGRLTRCKPISDADLARFIAGCIDDPKRHKQILPIGGPGPSITPLEQGEELFRLTGQRPRYASVSPALFTAMAGVLSLAGLVSQRAGDTAEYMRIARYYATQSMLVLDPETGRYSEEATPEFGTETLFDHYRELLAR